MILQDLADDFEKRSQLGPGTLLLLFINRGIRVLRDARHRVGLIL
jgi:hypothetical protein